MTTPKITCPICCENVSRHKIISCPKCTFEVCHQCVIDYTKTLNTNIICMNSSCKQIWDRAFICRSFPASIVYGPLKKQRETALLEKEKAMLPATSQLIPMKKTAQDIFKEMAVYRAEIKKLKDFLNTKENQYYDLRQEMLRMERTLDGEITPENVQKKKDAPQIVCPCSIKDCRGFVFKTDYKCSICTIEICSKCYVVKEEDHLCKEEDISSVNLIKKDCKACPGCGALSRKTEGCSQVWCLVCHKAWNWNTGTIETGYIHATDYFNYMREKGLQIPNNPNGECHAGGGDPVVVITNLSKIYPYVFTKAELSFLLYRWQISLELNYRLREPAQVSLLDLRLKYLNNEIDDTKWKSMLHKRDKEYAFNMELYRMKTAYQRAIYDNIMILCRNYNKTIDILATNMKMIHQIHDMMQKEYLKLAKAFTSKRKSPFLRANEI